MNITEGRELKKKLLTSLTEPAFLKRAGLTKHAMLTDLAKAGINQLAADLEEQILRAEVKDEQSPVDPKAVLAVCRGALEYFRKVDAFACEDPVDTLLDRIFRRTLLLLYPNVGVEPVPEDGRMLELVFCRILRVVLQEWKLRFGHNPTFDFDLLTEAEAKTPVSFSRT